MRRRSGLLLSTPLLSAVSLFLLSLSLSLSLLVDAARQEARPTVYDLQRDLTFDGNRKLALHTVLYTTACTPPFASTDDEGLLEVRLVDGAAAEELGLTSSTTTTDSICDAVLLERGVDASIVHAYMPYHRWQGDHDDDDDEKADTLKQFIHNARRVEVCFLNYVDRDRPLRIEWLDTNNEPRTHMEIKYGERNTRCFSSYLGHTFQAVKQKARVVVPPENPQDGEYEKPVYKEMGEEQVVGRIQIQHTLVYAFGEAELVIDRSKTAADYENEIVRTLRDEWKRHHRVQRTFSPLGFAKGRLPDDIFASMSSFFYNNRNHAVLEEWNGKGVFVNWWETSCSFIQIPWQLKGVWQERLRLLVAAWAGGIDIEQTDMYGLRRYEQGARLLTHVDRVSTHAVSLIVNIAQSNLTEPWPVEVFDHADRLHEVVMSPGDVVYYESAKALHSRNRPLTGEHAHYVNLFTHYRPTGDPKWFQKPTDPHVPKPVLDSDEEEEDGGCHLVDTPHVADTANGQLGVVRKVQCEDPSLGQFLSPTLFRAREADDLITWWKRTAPAHQQEKYTFERSKPSTAEQLREL